MTAPRNGDSGETLVEILLSITILGVAVAALLFAMATAATTSGLHRRQAVGAVMIRDAAEALQTAAVAYSACASSYSVAGIPGAIFQVQRYWRDGQWQPGCSAATDDQGAQQVMVTVATTDARVLGENLVVVKRKP